MAGSDPNSRDPEPPPPEPPQAGDCCGDGCARCVNDVYEEAVQRHHRELAAWRLRQARDTR